MTRARSLPLAIAIVAIHWQSSLALAHDGLGLHTHEAPAAKAGREMAAAAKNLWASLTPEQRLKIGFDFTDALRHDWHFIPRPRKGLPLKEMSGEQKALAHALLASGLSQAGYIKAETIISLEQILASIEQGRGPVRDPELYFFNLFGNPDSPGAKEPWGWRVEGHHLALNFTIVGDKGVAGGPTFMGTNPGEVKTGPRQGLRILAEEEELARKLVKSLDDGQRKKAVVQEVAPRDILSMAARKAAPLQPAGILTPDLGAEQKEILNSIIVLLRGAASPGARRERPGQDPQGGRRQGRLRLGRRLRTGTAALLPHPGADIPDRVRQHAEQRQPRPQRLAGLRGRLRRRPPEEALRVGDRRARPREVRASHQGPGQRRWFVPSRLARSARTLPSAATL